MLQCVSTVPEQRDRIACCTDEGGLPLRVVFQIGILSGYLTAILLFTNQMCTECIIIGGLIHPMKGNADTRIWELLNVNPGLELQTNPKPR